MGANESRPVRSKYKESSKSHYSTDDAYELDFNRSPNTVVNFQDSVWPKSSKEKNNGNVCSQENKYVYNQTPLYGTPPTNEGSSDPVYLNARHDISHDGSHATCSTASSEKSDVTKTVDSYTKRHQRDSLSSSDNDDSNTIPFGRPNSKKRSSISSINAKLPPLPEAVEKTILGEKECEDSDRYGTVLGKDRSNEYTTIPHFERPNLLLNTHDNTDIPTNDSVTTECVSDREGLLGDDALVPRDLTLHVTLQSKDVEEQEEEASHGAVSKDLDSDEATRDLSSQERKPVDCDYEPVAEKRSQRRVVSYKKGRFYINDTPRYINQNVAHVAQFHPSQGQLLKPTTTNVRESSPTLQHLQGQPGQPFQAQQPSQPIYIEPDLSLWNDPTYDNQSGYLVNAGSEQRFPGMTINVPSCTDSNSPSHVELRLSSNPEEFPVLSVDQRPLTSILHCLPLGSTFATPVVVSLDLPASEGPLEVLYSPRDLGENNVWTKLRTTDTCKGRTRMTDGRKPHENKVLLLKNGRQAVLVLHHLCSFVVIENKSVQTRKAEVAVFLQTMNINRETWFAIFRVAIGCDKNKMNRRQKFHQEEGYRMIENTELLLYKAESGSEVEVGIRDVEWMFGSMQKQSKTCVIHGLDCLWSGLEATSQFWAMSKGSKQMEEQLTCTIFVRQEGRLEKPIGIYCPMANDLRTQAKSRRTVAVTRSSSALLKEVNLRSDNDATNPSNSDSDLSLVTEDLSSRRHDDVVNDSDHDFELNCYASGKEVIISEVASDRKPCKFSSFLDDRQNTDCDYNHDSAESLAKSLNRFACTAEDLKRIKSTVRGTLITQPDLEWILAS